MRKLVLFPLFFCLLLTLIANFPSVHGVQLSYVGNAHYNYITNSNPAYVICYNRDTGENDALYVLVNYSTTSTAELKIWSIKDAEMIDSESLTLASANIPLGAGVFRYVGYGSFDGFWVLTAQLLCTSNDIDVILYVRGWFYNYSSKSATYLGEKSQIVLDLSSSLTAYNYMFQTTFGNPIYLSGKTWVSIEMFLCYQKGDGYKINSVWGGIYGLSTTQIVGASASIAYVNTQSQPDGMDVLWSTVQFSESNPDMITALMFYRKGADTYVGLITYHASVNTLNVYGSQFGTTNLWVRNNCLWRGIIPASTKKIPLFKPIGIQKSVSGGNNYFIFYIPITYTNIGQTKMQYARWVAPYTFANWGYFQYATLYVLNGVVYSIDVRDAYSATTDAYFYSPSGVFFSAGYDPESGVETILIQLGVNPSQNVFITGQQTFWEYNPTSNQIKLYILATAIPTVYEVDVPDIPETPRPEEPDYPSLVVSWGISAFLIPAIFLILPAVLFGVVIGGNGVLIGLALGTGIGYMAGILPSWLLILVALALAVLFFSKITKSGEIGE